MRTCWNATRRILSAVSRVFAASCVFALLGSPAWSNGAPSAGCLKSTLALLEGTLRQQELRVIAEYSRQFEEFFHFKEEALERVRRQRAAGQEAAFKPEDLTLEGRELVTDLLEANPKFREMGISRRQMQEYLEAKARGCSKGP